MNIVFALMAHSDLDLLGPLISTMIQPGHRIVVHVDAKVGTKAFEALYASFRDNPAVLFAERVKVAWGEWSVVQATLNCLDVIDHAGWEPDYVYLMSGADYPIRSSDQLVAFLDRNRGDEFIESVPSESTQWVKGGPQRERYQYYWYFNWRGRPQLTERAFALQKSLGVKRQFVRGMDPHIGSQWWVMTWPTLKQILRLAREPDITSFFRTTLVPDELFFQTLVRQIVPHERVIGCPLTFHQFSDYGYPVVYYADHLDYLVRQRFFMARKLSPRDMALRRGLDAYWLGERKSAPFPDEAVGLRGTEYEDWRLAYRYGPPTTLVVGTAGQPWATARRLGKVSFVVVGTSVAELRVVHRLLSANANLRLHGQLFHPSIIEFAGAGEEGFASYRAQDTLLRDVSPAEFLSDVIRAEPDRMSGFLLRAGHVPAMLERLCQRGNVRLLILDGDPLTAFSENVTGQPPRLADDDTADVPPEAAAYRFRLFLKDHEQTIEIMDKSVSTANGAKPKGWVARLQTRRPGREWRAALESCLGITLTMTPEVANLVVDDAMRGMAARREATKRLLVEGGIDPLAFDMLGQDARSSALALALA